MSISGTDFRSGNGVGNTGTRYAAKQSELISSDGDTCPPPPGLDLVLTDDELGGGGGGGPGPGGGARGLGPEDTGAELVLAVTGGDGDCPLSDVEALTKFPRFKELLPPKAQTASLNL